MSKKCAKGMLRFVSMPFRIFEKGVQQKIFARNFKICQDAFS